MRIVYALSDREGARFQLTRFLEASHGFQIKSAGYSSIGNIPLDWTLDALKSIYGYKTPVLDNEIINSYYNQIKSFAPDLIISDLEPFTSFIANLLNIRLWQVSPRLLSYASTAEATYKVNLGSSYGKIIKDYADSHLISRLTKYSEQNFVYSHYGDAINFRLKPGFNWMRPYHITGKKSKPCEHNIVSAMIHNHKHVIKYLKKYSDVVLFSSFLDESYKDIILKNIYNYSEYACNLYNSNVMVHEGYNEFVADAYYNQKRSIILPNFNEPECIVNALYSKRYKLATVIFHSELLEEIDPINYNINSDIHYLHERIKELL